MVSVFQVLHSKCFNIFAPLRVSWGTCLHTTIGTSEKCNSLRCRMVFVWSANDFSLATECRLHIPLSLEISYTPTTAPGEVAMYTPSMLRICAVRTWNGPNVSCLKTLLSADGSLLSGHPIVRPRNLCSDDGSADRKWLLLSSNTDRLFPDRAISDPLFLWTVSVSSFPLVICGAFPFSWLL